MPGGQGEHGSVELAGGADINRKNGERLEVPLICRLDTAEELSIYEAGGVLQRLAQHILETSKDA